MRWSPEAEYRAHPAYALAITDAIEVARAHALAGLSVAGVERADGGDWRAVASIERELRGMLADYERRRRG